MLPAQWNKVAVCREYYASRRLELVNRHPSYHALYEWRRAWWQELDRWQTMALVCECDGAKVERPTDGAP